MGLNQSYQETIAQVKLKALDCGKLKALITMKDGTKLITKPFLAKDIFCGEVGDNVFLTPKQND